MLIREFGLCNCSTICIEATLPGTGLMARPPICTWISVSSAQFLYSTVIVSTKIGHHPGVLLPQLPASCSVKWFLLWGLQPAQLHQAAYHHTYNPLYTLGNFAARARNLFFTYDSSLMSKSRLTVLGDANSPHTSQTSQGMFQASHTHLFLPNAALPAQRLRGDQDLTYLLPRRSCRACEEGLISAFLMICFLFSV